MENIKNQKKTLSQTQKAIIENLLIFFGSIIAIFSVLIILPATLANVLGVSFLAGITIFLLMFFIGVGMRAIGITLSNNGWSN